MAGMLVSCGQVGTGMCLSGMGYKSAERTRANAVKTAANIRQIAAGVIAADNAARLVENYRDQRNIARRMTAISKEAQDHLVNHFWPREEQFLNEFSEPEVLEEVEVLGRRYAGRMLAPIAKQFADQIRIAKCNLSRYCTNANQKVLQDLLLARSAAFANARVAARNLAFKEFRARTDINYKRRMQAVSWGNGMIQQAASLYESAFRGYANAGGVLSQQLNSAFQAFGYARGQRQQANAYMSSLDRIGDNEVMATYSPAPNGQGVPTYNNVTAFGYSSVNSNFQGVNTSNVVDWNTNGLENRGLPSNYFNLQSESQNEIQVGQEDLARTGTAIFPVIGSTTGETVEINLDIFPLANVKHKVEGNM